MDTFAFLLNASRTGSWSTIRAYVYGLCRLEDWTDRHGLGVLELTPRQADEYIYSLRARDLAPFSIRLDAAAASAFFFGSSLTASVICLESWQTEGSSVTPFRPTICDIILP